MTDCLPSIHITSHISHTHIPPLSAPAYLSPLQLSHLLVVGIMEKGDLTKEPLHLLLQAVVGEGSVPAVNAEGSRHLLPLLHLIGCLLPQVLESVAHMLEGQPARRHGAAPPARHSAAATPAHRGVEGTFSLQKPVVLPQLVCGCAYLIINTVLYLLFIITH